MAGTAESSVVDSEIEPEIEPGAEQHGLIQGVLNEEEMLPHFSVDWKEERALREPTS